MTPPIVNCVVPPLQSIVEIRQMLGLFIPRSLEQVDMVLGKLVSQHVDSFFNGPSHQVSGVQTPPATPSASMVLNATTLPLMSTAASTRS